MSAEGDAATRRIDRAVKELAPEGRLTCEAAHRLAEELGVEPLEVGKAADRMGIKVVACRLGCF